MKDKALRDLIIVISILVLIISRWISGDAQWMGYVACAGILTALFVLYDDLKAQYAYHNKFTRIRGLFLIIFIGVAVVLTLEVIGIITLSSKAIDELSLITLLISLPDKFYTSLAAAYLHVEKYQK